MPTLDQKVRQAQQRLNANHLLEAIVQAALAVACAWSALLLAQRALGLGPAAWYGLPAVPLVGWGIVTIRARRRLLPARRHPRRDAVIALVVAAAAGLAAWPLARYVGQGVDEPLGLGLAGATLLVLTVGAAWRRRTNRLQAAVVVDKLAGLKERVGTAVTVPIGVDPWTRAAADDAAQAVARVHVPACIPVRAPQRWPGAAVAVGLAVLLGLLLPTFDPFARQSSAGVAAESPEQAQAKQEIATAVNEQLERLREITQAKPELARLQEVLEPLELPDHPGATPEDVQREALKKLDNIAQRLQEDQADSAADMVPTLKRHLSQLSQPTGNDPASQLQRALSAGDFAGAKSAMEELKQEFDKAARSDDPERQQQAEDLKQRLTDLALQLDKLGDTTALRRELQNRAGLSEEDAEKLLKDVAKTGSTNPDELERELQRRLGETGMSKQDMQNLARKMAQNQKACNACKGLGQALAQAAQAQQQSDVSGSSGSGSGQSGGGAMSDALGQMSDLELAEALAAELEMQLSELDQLREGVRQGTGTGSQRNQRPGGTGQQAGIGYGPGVGKERVAHNFVPTRELGESGEGAVIGRILVDGPMVKGEARAEVREAVRSAVRESQDAIERERIPRQYHSSMRAYFEQLAGLERAPLGETPAAPGSP